MQSGRCLSVCLSVLSCLSVCNVGLLLPNGLMDQGETWHSDRPRPRPHCVRWGDGDPAPPPLKRSTVPPIFGPCVLWPNGWMNDDATLYGGRPRPRPHWLDGAPAPHERGTAVPLLFGTCLSWPNGRPSQLLLSTC